jgi:hypothetical protein
MMSVMLAVESFSLAVYTGRKKVVCYSLLVVGEAIGAVRDESPATDNQ